MPTYANSALAVTYTSTDTATTSNGIWQYWVITNGSTNYRTDAVTVWNRWHSTPNNSIPNPYITNRYTIRQRPNADAHVEAWKERNRRLARFRSLRLLLTFLSETQRKQLRHGSFFDVVGGETGDIYRIHWQRHDSMIANVQVLGKGRLYAANDNWKSEELKHVLCAHLNTGFLIGDQLLTQKLMIEKEEKHFLKIANKHDLRRKHTPALVKKAA